VRVRRWVLAAGVAALAAAIAVSTALGSGKAPAAQKAGYKAALVSDVVGFNDSGFNKLQLQGLKQAAKKIGGTAIPLVSHSQSDYQPNYTTAVHDGAKIIVAAGYLLGDTMKAFAQQYPSIKFAITDDPVSAVGGLKNEEGITYATEQGGCLVGVLAAKMAQSMGKKIIGRSTHTSRATSSARGRPSKARRCSCSTRTTSPTWRSARRSRRTRSAGEPR